MCHPSHSRICQQWSFISNSYILLCKKGVRFDKTFFVIVDKRKRIVTIRYFLPRRKHKVCIVEIFFLTINFS